VIEITRQTREKTVGHADAGSDGADVEVGRRPLALLHVKRVELRGAAHQEQKNAEIGRAARLDFRARLDALLLSAHAHDWQSDPFARGGYSYVAAGGEGAERELAAPLDDTLFFAGEAANFEGHNGTVNGAMMTGYRVAREILERL